MALNPDDLLIFKAREEEEEEKKKVKKPEAKPAAVPSVKPAPPAAPVQQQKPQPQPQAAAAKPQAVREKEEKVTFISQQKEENIPIVTENEAMEEEYGVTTTPVGRKGAKHLTAKESRRIAEHMTCELHPWRRAYAICDYCHRAFCYEDLIEHNGTYYCLDDIDKIPKLRASEVIRYNTLGFFAGALMLFVFLVFIYSSYQLVLRIPSLFGQAGGLNGLLANPLQALSFLLAETALATLSFIAAISVFLSRRASFRFSTIVSVLTVGLFSYMYLNSANVYAAVIAAMSFIAMVALAYSRVAIETLPEETELPASESLEIAKSSF
ncbi:MAG: hypothetical protein LVQ95_05290 [Candidatus Micrarchaeales archaeon]|nr:hypothetical protein [Candidatus Micrarchaeales archaeon]